MDILYMCDWGGDCRQKQILGNQVLYFRNIGKLSILKMPRIYIDVFQYKELYKQLAGANVGTAPL